MNKNIMAVFQRKSRSIVDLKRSRIPPVHFGEERYCMYAKGHELLAYRRNSM